MAGQRVLIVEDESLIALQLKLGLTKAGFVVAEPVASGEEAIEIARSEDPDAILMDISLLGEMDGIEAARVITGFSRAKIIFTTGYPDPRMRERAMTVEPAAFLTKPVAVASIKAAILGEA